MSVVQPKLNSVCVAEAKTKCEQNTKPQNESFMSKAASSVFTAAKGVANGVGNIVGGVCEVTSSAVGLVGDTVGAVGDAIGAVGDLFKSDEADQDKKTKGLNLES